MKDPQTLRLRRLGIDTHTDPVVCMRGDCHVCRSEGFEAHARVEIELGGRAIITTLNVVSEVLLAVDEAGLSEFAWRRLGAAPGDRARFSYPEPVASDSRLRAKMHGKRLTRADMEAIVRDVAAGIRSRCEAGLADARCVIERAPWEVPADPMEGVIVHELSARTGR